jgi:hypothetical protein
MIIKEGLSKGKFVQEVCFTVKGQECKEEEPAPGHSKLKIFFKI